MHRLDRLSKSLSLQDVVASNEAKSLESQLHESARKLDDLKTLQAGYVSDFEKKNTLGVTSSEFREWTKFLSDIKVIVKEQEIAVEHSKRVYLKQVANTLRKRHQSKAGKAMLEKERRRVRRNNQDG